ncbi:hypothetical protein GCM10017710_34780 [Arthrobacter ramosus]
MTTWQRSRLCSHCVEAPPRPVGYDSRRQGRGGLCHVIGEPVKDEGLIKGIFKRAPDLA